MRRLNILLIEDDENDALLLARALKRSGLYEPTLTRIDAEPELRTALAAGPWDIVISDWNLPQLEPLRAFEVFQASGLDIPFIYLSGAIGEAPVVAGLKAGAHNFLLKASLGAVAPAIQRELAEAEGRRQRRKAEHALRRSESRFRALWEGVRDAVVLADLDGNVTMFNRAAEQMFGYSREEMVGTSIARLLPPRFRDAQAAGLERHRNADDLNYTVELVGLRRDGGEFPLEISLTNWNDGERVQFAGVIRDISERRRTEEMRQARDAAEAAARAKAEFLASMSHEIRTPMNAVIGMSGLLRDTPLTELQQEFVETIRVSGEHLLAVINNILDFTKFETGHVELERRPFDLRSCVEEALELVVLRVAEKNLDLAFIDDPRVPRVLLGDMARLRQVIINLLSNAVKFTERGEVVVESAIVRIVDSYHEIRMEVRDTGIGLDERQCERLFKPFSQADASTSRQYGGTGLGLAICKQIVESMGGRIGVDSQPGLGSTFWFTFLAEPQAAGASAEGVPSILHGRHVLVVDDNPTHQRVLRLRTDSWGMFTTGEISPLVALERVRGGQLYDLALIDHRMPEMDGIALIREIRRFRPPRELPIVLMTSAGAMRRLVDSSGIDVQGILTKPLRHGHLRDTIITALDSRIPVLRQRAATPSSKPTQLEHSLRILLAEDNSFNQRVARLMLEKMGQQVTIVTNGREVLEKLEHLVYDVVLMDVEMPEMDGLTAAREICGRHPEGRRPRIVALTANALVGDRERYLANGMDDYISKPIRADELLRALRACRPLS